MDIFNQIGNYFQAQAALRRTSGEKNEVEGGVEEYEKRDNSDEYPQDSPPQDCPPRGQF